MNLKCSGRRLVPRLEKLESLICGHEPYEVLYLFGDNGDLGTVRLWVDGDHVEKLEVTDGRPWDDDEEDDEGCDGGPWVSPAAQPHPQAPHPR